MIYGYARVSNQDQNLESQKNLISRYGIDHKLMIDEWIEVEVSSRQSTQARKIDELLNKLQPMDNYYILRAFSLGKVTQRNAQYN